MDSAFKRRKQKIANAMNSLEQTSQNIQARIKIKAAQSDREVAFVLLDANLYELFVRFYLSERIMDVFSSWVAHCKAKAEERLRENLGDCLPESERYFLDVYQVDLRNIAIREDALRQKILEEIKKVEDEVSKEIDELQSYLFMLKRIK